MIIFIENKQIHEARAPRIIIKKIKEALESLFRHPGHKYVYTSYTVISNSLSGNDPVLTAKETGISVEVDNKTGDVVIAIIISQIPGYGTRMMRAVLDCLHKGTEVTIEDINHNATFFNKFRNEYPYLKFAIYSSSSSI